MSFYRSLPVLAVAVAATLPAWAEGALVHEEGLQAGQATTAPSVQGQQRDRARVHAGDQDQVYGWMLMTPSEQQAYRDKMRSLKTQEERDALRSQHHAEMQKRAAERGISLPDRPPSQAGAAREPPQHEGEKDKSVMDKQKAPEKDHEKDGPTR